MALTFNQRTKLKITRQLVLAGMSLGIIYIFFYYGFSDPFRYLVGAFSGILLGLLMAYYELVLFKRGAQNLKFIWLLLIRLFIYWVSIVVIIGLFAAISRMIRWDTSLIDVLTNEEFYIGYLLEGDFSVALSYSMFLAFSVNFVRMISRKMGQGVLMSYLTGTYYSPVHQARIVMFIKLKNAKDILARIGPKRYFSLLNDLFYDYSEPIVSRRGIIYEYVEDLAVITWSIDKGLARGNAMNTFFAIKEELKKNQDKYLHKYGFIPVLRAGLHIGSVIRAEIGEVKTQLVLHGDTMNTTARILSFGMEEDLEFITSRPLLHMIELPENVSKKEIGLISLKGKEEKLTLYSLNIKSDAH